MGRNLPTNNAYSAIADSIDVASALDGIVRNDLLPQRSDDRVGGQVGQRFVQSLQHDLELGTYEPRRAHFVQVPKPGYATRPAALLSVSDRVVYDALVAPLRLRIEKSLVSTDALLWPRAEPAGKRWTEFESLPLTGNPSHILLGDITGFYESIDHTLLKFTLIELTGRTSVIDALMDFLQEVMGSARGLPQGLIASDTLATAYINSVDAEMLREFPDYWRHGDDIRVAIDSHSEGLRAARHFESALRRRHLILNGSKTRVIRAETYLAQQSAVDQYRARIINQIRDALLAQISQTDPETIESVADMVDGVTINWITTWYEPEVDLEDLASQIAEKLNPAEAEIAEKLFKEAVDKAPGSRTEDSLSPEDFHSIIVSTMPALLAVKSPVPIEVTARILHDFPEKTPLFSNYLRAVAESFPHPVADAALQALAEQYLTGFQIAELLFTLRRVSRTGKLSQEDRDKIQTIAIQIASNEEQSFFERAEALRVLAELNKLEQSTFRRIWNRAPLVLRGELVAAAAAAARDEAATWAHAFVDSLSNDAVMQVVIKNINN